MLSLRPHLCLALLGILLGTRAAAQAPAIVTLPDTIAPPKALNLGSTSYFDGFGRTTEGWTWLQYGRFEAIDRITDATGGNAPYFKGTSIPVFSALTQICYTSAWQPFGGDAVGFSVAAPLVSLNSHFAADSPVKLNNNGFGIGDAVWGPTYQSKVYTQDGRPVFSWRFQLIIMSPTGDFNKHDSINQGAGYWGINPYIAATVLPRDTVELSTRFNYQYNLRSALMANPPPIPGVIYRNGQAGQIIYDNFDASLKVAEKLHLGVNGYFLDELTPDRTNGQIVPHALESEVYVGPGGRYVFDKDNALNVNFYLPVESHNGSPGPQVNFQYVHRF
jgi:hypothetical protein